ncbi:MAG: EAL domain-containing protein [Curvibacter lanceolatus]|jgi:diguanylate cyclase (GGDEF)-like protein/PAS domain S-box-containing protein|uniref:EAL domain-containing protein n=1 Tax=Curvibacter lanceolatus TaxID=86182 RepID=UPI0003829E3D|nr:EAL domain-containing protein [Curvibacter lanceolatus]MBV5290928.1 EAL domain-containing protein [Curvibacter lanceolatus]
MSADTRPNAAPSNFPLPDLAAGHHFDRLVRLAATLCGTHQAWVTVWHDAGPVVVAGTGVALGPMPWTQALDTAWENAVDTSISPFNPQQDPAWADHPWVQGPPGLCFLAGMVLRSRDGERLGMLCVGDPQPRELDAEQCEALDALASQALLLLEFGRQQSRWNDAETQNRQARQWHQLQTQAQRIAGQVAEVGGWILTLPDRQFVWSPEVAHIHGMRPETTVTAEQAFAFYLPDDQLRLDAAFRTCVRDGTRFELELMLRRADGQPIWVRLIGEAVRNEQGVTEAVQGALENIDARKREVETRLAIVRMQQEIANAELDLDGVLELMALRAAELTGAEGSSVELVEAQDCICRACAGTLSAYVGRRIGLHDTLAGQVLQQNTTVRCQDTEQDPRIQVALARALGVRSLIVAPLKAGDQMLGVIRVVSGRPGAFSLRDETHLQILVLTLGGVIQRQRLGAKLQASEAQYRLLFDLNPQPMWVHSIGDMRMLAANKAMVAHYGYSHEDLRHMKAPEFWVDDSETTRLERLASIQRGDVQINTPRCHRRRDGSLMDVEVTANTITFDGEAARLVIATDVTERQRAARDQQRLSRAQLTLSACNEALVRASTELGLLEDVTRTLVEVGGYRLAWVAYIGLDEPQQRIRAVARYGQGSGFLERLNQVDAPQSPMAQALQDGRLLILADLQQSPDWPAWQPEAVQHGLRGMVCLPLRIGARRLGLLTLHSDEPCRISHAEEQLLQSLSNDLAFGISNLRAQEEQNRLQHAVLKLATAVSASTGTEFFDQLARNMAEALDAQAGFVARLLPATPAAPARMRLIAAQVAGQAIAQADYLLAGTPCEQVLKDGMGLVRKDLACVYPGMAGKAPAVAYVGRRLDNAAGEPVGLVFALFERPLAQTSFLVSALHIFAARAGAELARLAADSQIRDQASLLDKAQDAIIVRRIGGGLSYWNKGAERLYGFTAAQALDPEIGRRIEREHLHFDLDPAQVLQEGEWSGEIEQQRQDGTLLTVESRWTLVHDAFGTPEAILSINTDVTARKQAEQQIQRLAFFDALTELPNRQLLMDRLQHALASSTRTGTGGALLFIDLDNFKTLNDTLGHDQGDELLRQVARRLSACVRESDTVARLGGDEFVVMLENLGHAHPDVIEHASRIGGKVLATLAAPFQLAGQQHESSCSIGVAPFMDGNSGISELLKQADLAMYQAKTAGRNTLRFFDPAMQAEVSARATLEAALRQALARGELMLHYQPQTEQGRHVSGVEALVRWRHPVRGMVSPAEFIPLAEDTGLIIPIGRWVLDTACSLLARWAGQAETEALSVAVNVSSRQFKHPDFVQHVISALQAHGARPDRLKLELTESLLVDDMDAIIERMGQLKNLGVGFSLDDFGTGYSSLSYLKRLPLDQLKIDQSFVRDVLTDPNDAAIVRTIINLGRSLGLAVIAEGVESRDQQDFLARHDCHAFQGYAFGKPMADQELSLFLSQNQNLRQMH